MKRRILSIMTALALCLSLCPTWAFAVEGEADTGLCAHHTEHTDGCGYTAPTAGNACGHEHTGECDAEETLCVHSHDETCYGDGELPADGGDKAADACAHACTVDGGCVTLALDCRHEHDETCGYVQADPGQPCGYECPLCSIENLIAALPDSVTADNRAEVGAQVEEILDLCRELTGDEQGQIDISRCLELQVALDEADAPMTLDEPAAPPEGALAIFARKGEEPIYPTTEAEFRAAFLNNDTAGAETTVTLLDTVTLTGKAIWIDCGTFTLDLNGKNINFTGSSYFSVGWDGSSSSGGNLITCGSGTVQASSFAVLASDKGTVTLAGGTFSTEREDTISVQAIEASTLNVIGPDVEIEGLYVGAAAQVSLTAGKYNKIVTGSVKQPLSGLLGDNCAYYRNGSPIALADLPVGEDSGLPTLPGPVTVGVCEHPGLKATPDEGGGTHSGKCDYCSYAAAAAPCSYDTEYQHDENSHWLTCTVCGGSATPEAHYWLVMADLPVNGVTQNREVCSQCDFTKNHFTVTVTVPDGLTYGNTGGVTPSYTLSEEKEYDQVDWHLNGEEVPVKIGSDGTLPAGLPAGNYRLDVWGTKGEGAEFAVVFIGTANFTVAPAQLPDVFTLDETEFTYDTTAHTPAVTAEDLTENTDYTVAYSNNTAPGAASVTLTGKGNYTGTVTKKFTIKKAAPTITNASTELFYGQKLSDITSIIGTNIPGTWTWANPNEQPLEDGKTYSASFTPGDAANYESVPDVPVKVIVSAAAPEITLSVLPDLQQAGKDVEITYTVKNAYDPNLEDVPEVTLSYKIGAGEEQTLEEGVTSFTIPEGTAPDTKITVYARTQAVSGKYSSKSQTAKVGVTDKIPVTITGVTAPDKVYDG